MWNSSVLDTELGLNCIQCDNLALVRANRKTGHFHGLAARNWKTHPPGCGRLHSAKGAVQSLRFGCAGRTFSLSITM